MCHIYQLEIINLLPDQHDQFTSFYEVITYRPIYKEVLPPDTREQYFFNTLMLKSQVIECITSSLSWFSNS